MILRLCRSCGIFECSFTRSKRTYKRHVPICRRNASRKAARRRTPSFRRTQAPFASTTTSCSCSPWFFVLLFPHDKNFAFIFDMQALVRLFLPCGSPCVRSTSDCAVWARSWRIKRSGTSREMPLSMRVLSVVPRYAVAGGSLKLVQRGNGDRENT